MPPCLGHGKKHCFIKRLFREPFAARATQIERWWGHQCLRCPRQFVAPMFAYAHQSSFFTRRACLDKYYLRR